MPDAYYFITLNQFFAFVGIWTLISLAAVGLGMWVRGATDWRNELPADPEPVEESEDPEATVEFAARSRRPYTGTIHAPQYDRAVASDERTVVIKQVPR